LKLKPGEAVTVEIEVLASSTLYRAGETLQLDILGRDSYEAKVEGPVMKHGPLRNAGQHVLRTGGRYDSHLLIPVIPSKEAAS
jgi:predicted acyl esterase